MATLAWLWHSKQDGPEDIPKKGIEAPIRPSESVHLAPTYVIVIYFARLLRQLYPDQRFHFFVDNLFLTVPVAQALLFLAVLCTGTTRKNAAGVPNWLIELKNKNQVLIWNSTFAEIVNGVLCFLWQDNNAVLGITTGYDLAQRVLRDRKRPNLTSTNAHIVWPVFGDQVRKRLWIPKVIDEYNHNMNGVDLANQLVMPAKTYHTVVAHDASGIASF